MNGNEKPEILDGRTAYGDKVQNQIEQAAMINAYLSGREVRPVDVPIIMILIKAHRIGKMPDYKDSYDDIEGYLSIAKDVIGDDMIEANTAKEYMQIKSINQAETAEEEARLMSEFKVQGSVHRTCEVEFDTLNFKGLSCRRPKGHLGQHIDMVSGLWVRESSDSTKPRHPYDRDFNDD